MVKPLKALEKENARLKKLVADQALDIEILKEAVQRSAAVWIRRASIHTLFFAKKSPGENSYVESFHGKL